MSWDIIDSGDCPHCGCPEDELEHDVVHHYDENGEFSHIQGIVTCPKCKARLHADPADEETQ